MEIPKDYLAINKASWNARTPIHYDSDFYDTAGFITGKTSLNSIELDLLGDISGKSILHLQCHFGQDTISFDRMGAQSTGADLSDKAIEKARALASQTGSTAEFVCCDLYDLPQHLDKKFDLVFTSYGTISWLPDLDKWAAIIAHFLKDQGQFIFVEFHPVIWMFDDNFKGIEYSYFNTQAIIEQEEGTYSDRNASINQKCITWNHSISEVVNNLIKHGMQINVLDEYDYSPYDCLQELIEESPKKFRIKHLGDKLPMVYAIVATKKK